MSESEGLWIIEKTWPQTAAQTLFALGVLWVDIALPSGGSPGSLAPPARFIFFSFLLGFPAWVGNYWFDSRAISNVQGLVLLFSWLHLRLHWRSLFTFTGAGEVIEEKYMAPIYNWYRDWWNPDLRAQRNARRGRRDQNLSSP